MNLKNIIVSAVVALVVAAGLVFVLRPATPAAPEQSQVLGGAAVNPNIDAWPNGLQIGDEVNINKNLTMGPRVNQIAWRNTTGRVVYVNANRTTVGYNSGTASSSYVVYVATSSTASITGSESGVRPTNKPLIDGAIISTSTPSNFIVTGTSTTAGTAVVAIPDGAYLVANIQRWDPNCNVAGSGVCETATSTARGITNFLFRFHGNYKQ